MIFILLDLAELERLHGMSKMFNVVILESQKYLWYTFNLRKEVCSMAAVDFIQIDDTGDCPCNHHVFFQSWHGFQAIARGVCNDSESLLVASVEHLHIDVMRFVSP